MSVEPTLQPDLRGGNPPGCPGGGASVEMLHGQDLRGPPRDARVVRVEDGEDGQGSGSLSGPPGLTRNSFGSRGVNEQGYREPSNVHGGDPASGQPGHGVSGSNLLGGQGVQNVSSGEAAGSSGGGDEKSSARGGAAPGKSATDPFGMLAQGIAQLQKAMSATIAIKAQEQEQVKPGISELPKLPELSETSCIDVGDWLHSLECPMGDLSNGSAVWWSETLQCLDRFYESYLKSSNLAKLSLKPETFATIMLKEDKWGRVDKRATSMILAALPESVKAEVLASRLTGTLPVLGRVMVLYRPGSAAERQQILKALESPSTATSATEAVDQLRRWSRWLRRAGDIGLQRPDASVLLRGLDNISRKVLLEHGEIMFRINMMRYTLEVDVKPTQESVQDLHQALLSEFEQVAFRGRTKGATTTASMRAMTASSTTGTPPGTEAAGNPGESSPSKSKGPPCKFFLTDQGCRRGAACKFNHEVEKKLRQGRCWTCGSKQHVAKACPTKDKGSPSKAQAKTGPMKPETATSASASLAAIAPESAHPAPPTTPKASSPMPGTPSASSSTVDLPQGQSSSTASASGDLRDLLQEANTMLKEMRHLKLLTVKDVMAQARSLGCQDEEGRTGLLDSGASHPYREGTVEEVRESTSVKVQLANGEEVTLAQNRAGTLLATRSSPNDRTAPIVPLGSLVQDLNCELTWGRKRGLEIRHPIHGTIRPVVVDKCPVIGETQALDLIKELEAKRVEELRENTRATQKALWLWDETARWARHLEVFLQDGTRARQLLAMETDDSPFKDLEASTKAAMAEELALDDRAGWNYLKALPVSRRKRKQLMRCQWVVNLFAGPGPDTAEFKNIDGDSMLVEMDITRSRAFDMRKSSGAYRALLWAAATGRVKGVLSSPPMRSKTDEELVAKAMWFSLIAKAARATLDRPPPFVPIEGKKVLAYMQTDPQAGLKLSWKSFVEVMCLENQGESIVTNLDYDKELKTVTNGGGRWTMSFKEETAEAMKRWDKVPESRQVRVWMAKMDKVREKSFLESLSDKELAQWKVHVRNNHIPYNRKCKACVESSATGRKHVRIKSPSAYCLSLDICGPFRARGSDPDHRDYRYALVGAYVIPRIVEPSNEVPHEEGPPSNEVPHEEGPPSHEVPHEEGPPSHEVPHEEGPPSNEVPHEEGPPSHEVPHEEGPPSHEVPHEEGPPSNEVPHEEGPPSHEVPHEEGPPSHEVPHEEGPPSNEVPHEEGPPSREVPHQEGPHRCPRVDGCDFCPEVASDEGEGVGPLNTWTEGEVFKELEAKEISPEEERKLPKGMTEEDFKEIFRDVDGIVDYKVIYVSRPLRSRTTKDVLEAVQDLYLRLKAEGLPVLRVHAGASMWGAQVLAPTKGNVHYIYRRPKSSSQWKGRSCGQVCQGSNQAAAHGDQSAGGNMATCTELRHVGTNAKSAAPRSTTCPFRIQGPCSHQGVRNRGQIRSAISMGCWVVCGA